jgi:hypothetical protein
MMLSSAQIQALGAQLTQRHFLRRETKLNETAAQTFHSPAG